MLPLELGNRNYRHYNKIVDLVDTTLQELGARRVGVVGKADEAKGGTATDEDFLEWNNSILESLGEMFGVERRPMVYSPELDVVAADPKTEVVIMAREAQSNINILAAPMVVARGLTNGLDRRCFHLEFDLSSNRSMKYQTGDHLLVWPHNSASDVQGLCRLLGLGEMERTQPVEIKSRLRGGNYSTAFPSPTTKETVLRHYLDISGPVSRDVLRQLAAFSPTPAAGEYLLTLAKDKAKFHTTVSLGLLSLANVMQLAAGDQVWNQLPFAFLLEYLGKLQPRYYSIASSPSVSPFQPAITLAITRKALDASACGAHLRLSHFHGVASNYLLAVKRGQRSNGNSQQPLDEGPDYGIIDNQVLVQIRRSTFKLPANPQRPIVMIAAGTGVAPFRAFVQERAAMAARGLPVGESLLLFGCRSPTEDYLYGHEWRDHVATLPGFEVINAFSRYGENKVYVQDKLVEVRVRIAGLLEKDAAVYICGSADMAREVRRALMKVVMEMRNLTEEEAERYVMEDMKKAKRLQEDVWSG